MLCSRIVSACVGTAWERLAWDVELCVIPDWKIREKHMKNQVRPVFNFMIAAGIWAVSTSVFADHLDIPGANIAVPNPEYTCGFIIENVETDERLRSFLLDYTYGMVTGLNVQLILGGKAGLDFSRIEMPMMLGWSLSVCQSNPDIAYYQAVYRMFDVIRSEQIQADMQVE